VTTATNGKEAIDALLAPDTDFDLILTDIMMPEVDGM
jgi:YesN/AraC family two-component response regulator